MNTQQLREQVRWITYQLRAKENTDKLAKVPYDPKAGREISAHKSENWTSYDVATKTAKAYNAKHNHEAGAVGSVAVGVVMNGDGVVCIDIDDGLTLPATAGGEWGIAPHALAVLKQCAPTLIEISVSRKGLHIFGRLATPQHEKHYHINGHIIEVYSRGQFIAWTGYNFYKPLGIGHLQSNELAPIDAVIDWLEEHNAPPKKEPSNAPPPHTPQIVRDVATSPRKSTPTPDYKERERAWYVACFKNRLATAVRMVEQAQPHTRHKTRFDAGRTIGGYLATIQRMGYDPMTEDSVVDALYMAQEPNGSKAERAKEEKAITNGIKNGKESPLQFPPFDPDDKTATPEKAWQAVEGDTPHRTPQSGSDAGSVATPLPDDMLAKASSIFDRMARGREQIAQDIEEGKEQRLEEYITSPNGLPLIVAGTTLLAARPKMRKSWLALHMANCIVSGEPLFNDPRFKIVKRGHVIYLDLEQMADTALTRMDAMNTHKEFTGYVTRSMWDELVDEFPHMERNELAKWYIDDQWRKRKDTATPLVMAIIDTLNPLLPTAHPKGVDPVTAEYMWFHEWTKWAQQRGMAVVFVSHLNKAVSMYDNPADAVPGGARLAGAVDILTITSDNRGDKKDKTAELNTDNVVLRGQMRNGSIDPLLLKFVEEGTYHHITDNSTERQRIDWSVIRQDIGKAVDAGYTRQAQITKFLEGKHASGTIRKTLRAMVRQGHLIEAGRGEYSNATGWPYHKGNK